MIEHRTNDVVVSDDEALEDLGVVPRLPRPLRTLTTLALAVASEGPTLSVLLGGSLLISVIGGFGVWVALFVLMMQIILCLVFAELASQYPLEGGLYQWATRIAGDYVGLLVGIFYLAFWVLAFGPIGMIAASVLHAISPSFNPTQEAGYLLGSLVMVVSGLVLAVRLRFLAYVNAVGVAAELFVLIGAGLLLLTHASQTLSTLWHTTPGFSFPLTPILAIIFVLPALSGFELVGAFSEEAVDSQRNPPHAIIRACAGAGGAFCFFLFAAVLATPHLDIAAKNPSGFVPAALATLGNVPSKLFLIAALVALVSTTMASIAGVSRLIFGMSRDGSFPGRRLFQKQARWSGEPIYAIVLATLLFLAPQFLPNIAVIVASTAGMVAAAYLLVIAGYCIRRLRGDRGPTAPFILGRRGAVIGGVLFVWLAFIVIEDLVPRTSSNPNLGSLPVFEEILIGAFLFANAYWFGFARHRNKPTPQLAQGE
jgi:amino acid transporter